MSATLSLDVRHTISDIARSLETGPITGDNRAYSRGWNQSQGTIEHIPGVGTNHRGLASIFQGWEPITAVTAGAAFRVGIRNGSTRTFDVREKLAGIEF
eukprot:632675-Prorocentrum_minimum.AAC.1